VAGGGAGSLVHEKERLYQKQETLEKKEEKRQADENT
jgi:hypothetical protein